MKLTLDNATVPGRSAPTSPVARLDSTAVRCSCSPVGSRSITGAVIGPGDVTAHRADLPADRRVLAARRHLRRRPHMHLQPISMTCPGGEGTAAILSGYPAAGEHDARGEPSLPDALLEVEVTAAASR
jgi:hypothetical protein